MRGRVLVTVQFSLLAVLIVLPSSGGVSATTNLLSRVLTGAAGAILAIAFINLRASVTVFPEPRENVPFITNGIYAYIRHPMYVGVLLFACSIALVKWTLPAMLVWFALFIDLQVKYRYEDRLLAARWPEAALYQATVGALLPKFKRP